MNKIWDYPQYARLTWPQHLFQVLVMVVVIVWLFVGMFSTLNYDETGVYSPSCTKAQEALERILASDTNVQ